MRAVPWRSGSRHISTGSLLSVGRAGEDPGRQCCLVWQTRAQLSPLGATPAEGAFGIQPSAVATPRLCSQQLLLPSPGGCQRLDSYLLS